MVTDILGRGTTQRKEYHSSKTPRSKPTGFTILNQQKPKKNICHFMTRGSSMRCANFLVMCDVSNCADFFKVMSKLSPTKNIKKWQSNLSYRPETNIAPENRPFQKETNIPTIHFQVLLLLVSGRGFTTFLIVLKLLKSWDSTGSFTTYQGTNLPNPALFDQQPGGPFQAYSFSGIHCSGDPGDPANCKVSWRFSFSMF